jgi:hypothetical protein
MDALRDLCKSVPDPNVTSTALEALFDIEPAVAAEIAEKRLVESLSHDCVPVSLVKLLFEKRLDPFRLVVDRLDALGCDRKRLRPGNPLFPSGAGTKEIRDQARALSERMSGSCQGGWRELIGIDKPDVSWEEDP